VVIVEMVIIMGNPYLLHQKDDQRRQVPSGRVASQGGDQCPNNIIRAKLIQYLKRIDKKLEVEEPFYCFL
jgi:hypothetical protein